MPETLLIASLCITVLILAWGWERAAHEAREYRELYHTQRGLANALAERLGAALTAREELPAAALPRRPWVPPLVESLPPLDADDERIAALMEGEVTGADRVRLIHHLSTDLSGDYEVFADTSGVLRALEEEEDARG